MLKEFFLKYENLKQQKTNIQADIINQERIFQNNALMLKKNNLQNNNQSNNKSKKKSKHLSNKNLVSFNYEEIKLKKLLHIFADHLNKNIIISDSVAGNVSLNLQDVYWHDAFNFILTNYDLGLKQNKNILYIAKNEELLAMEKQIIDYKTLKQKYESINLHNQKKPNMEYIQINHANGENLVALILENNKLLLSSVGKVSFDKRTNVIVVQDYLENIKSIKQFIKKLDVAVRQILIETQIVKVNDDFKHAFGMKFGGGYQKQSSKMKLSTNSGNGNLNIEGNGNVGIYHQNSKANPFIFDFNLGEINTSLGFSLAKLPNGIFIDLELQALEKENKAVIFARPKLLTLDKQTAIIESGKEIPYVTKSRNSLDPYVIFKKAALRLEVTPFIKPNGKILLDLKVNKDQPGIQVMGISQAPIDTTQITTKVIANNGETIVLGGIFSERKIEIIEKVPFFGDLPIVGNLFKAESIERDKSEILIFVTPKLVSL